MKQGHWVELEERVVARVARQATFLLVEDDHADALIVRRALEQDRDNNYRLIHVTKLSYAVALLDSETVDAVLLDLGLPDSGEGLHALDVVLEHAPSVPVIILTGLDDHEIGLQGIRGGAEDFLTKSLAVMNILPRVIQYAIERKQMKESLRLSEERLEMALHGGNVGVWDWDIPTDAFHTTPEWRSIMGLDSASPRPRIEDWQAKVHPEDRDAFIAAFRHFMTGGASVFTQVHRTMRDDGGLTWVQARGQCVRDASGVPRRMLGAISDITKLKETEAEMTAAREAAERASTAKSTFLANMSHELRTPLNAIIGFSEVMQRQTFGPFQNPKYLEYAGDILSSGRHLHSIISDILALAKMGSSTARLAESNFPFADLAPAAIRFVREMAKAKNIALKTRIPADLPIVHADQRQLTQVLINLLANAIKFSKEGGEVELAKCVTEAGELEITVTDHGIGIPADRLAAVLEPFEQVTDTLERNQGGTGLGLPIARSIVELHCGTLTLASTLGLGTTVTVRLPSARLRHA